MNEKLKFSWGHIIAFLALVIVSYVSFVGYTYLTDGNFTFALVGMIVTDVVFLAVFIGAQLMKSSGQKIRKKLVWERILIFGSPLVFAAFMTGFAHFWTIKTQDEELVGAFKNSINNSRQLFSDYETYSHQRIADYSDMLDKIIRNKAKDPKSFKEAGFTDGLEAIQKQNMIDILQLQLMSDNYTKLKTSAEQWIDKASEGASTWNVFIIGNTYEIKDALTNWEEELQGFASQKMKNEEMASQVSSFESMGAMTAKEGLDRMTASFKELEYPNWQAVVFGVLLYLLLLFPYFIQQRHGRQVAMGYSLMRKGKAIDSYIDFNEDSGDSDNSTLTRSTGRFKPINLD